MIKKRAELEVKLDEICRALEKSSLKEPQLGVLVGISGISMFFFYYAQYRNVNTYSELGARLLEETFDRLRTGYALPTYCTGIAGAGWTMEHLNEQGFIEIDNDGLMPQLDEYLHQYMSKDLAKGYYDILHGALGYGLYFLKRYHNTRSEELKIRYQTYLNELLAGLERLAEKDEYGLKWRSVLNQDTGAEGYNLSLSHGMSSIVNFLSRVHRIETFKPKVEPLLRGGIGYILSREKQTWQKSMFPTIVTIPDSPPNDGRLAWCYGDLGVGISLLQAAETLQDGVLKEKARQILIRTADQRGAAQCDVVDAAPCHGSFGLLQIYTSLFRKTGIKDFELAADHWLDEGLKMSVHQGGPAGYKQYHAIEGWQPRYGVLEGVAGIGLSIMNYLSDTENSWDEALFIN